jgi:hypothetical protein
MTTNQINRLNQIKEIAKRHADEDVIIRESSVESNRNHKYDMMITEYDEDVTYHECLELLREGECTVVFKKKDGTERTMLCTRSMNLIPEEHTPKGDSTKIENEEVVKVFDIESDGWRSFRIDSVISIALN